MGLVITKYEDVADTSSGNIQFDVSKFDYYMDSDTFPTDATQDFVDCLLEIGDVFSVTRQITTVDASGKITAVSESDFRIVAFITDISKKDRQIHDMGLAVTGNRVLYLKPVSIITSGGVETEYVVKEDDIFTDRNDNKWRVIKIIHEPYVADDQVYKKAVVQSIDLQGSE